MLDNIFASVFTTYYIVAKNPKVKIICTIIVTYTITVQSNLFRGANIETHTQLPTLYAENIDDDDHHHVLTIKIFIVSYNYYIQAIITIVKIIKIVC